MGRLMLRKGECRLVNRRAEKAGAQERGRWDLTRC